MLGIDPRADASIRPYNLMESPNQKARPITRKQSIES